MVRKKIREYPVGFLEVKIASYLAYVQLEHWLASQSGKYNLDVDFPKYKRKRLMPNIPQP
jgi:hypothetical protein